MIFVEDFCVCTCELNETDETKAFKHNAGLDNNLNHIFSFAFNEMPINLYQKLFCFHLKAEINVSSCEQMKVEPNTRDSRQAKALFKTDLRDRISEQQDQANTTDDSTNSIELMTTQTKLIKGCGAGGRRRRNTGEGNK